MGRSAKLSWMEKAEDDRGLRGKGRYAVPPRHGYGTSFHVVSNSRLTTDDFSFENAGIAALTLMSSVLHLPNSL